MANRRQNNRPSLSAVKKPRIKRGDTVYVLTGNSKGKTAVVKQVMKAEGKAIVEGVNLRKKATKPNPMLGIQGGIVEAEAPIALSNLMLFDHTIEKPTRVRREVVKGDGGKVTRQRVSVKSGANLDD